MHRSALKAVLAVLTLNKAQKNHLDRDRVVLVLSMTVTIALVALYAFGKVTSRW